ncbi:putative membrane protein [Synechococcus sp. WH 8101]|nr:putative membrane protein [Synechococcus sp. WH 8101]
MNRAGIDFAKEFGQGIAFEFTCVGMVPVPINTWIQANQVVMLSFVTLFFLAIWAVINPGIESNQFIVLT